jgi:hypothetical protein
VGLAFFRANNGFVLAIDRKSLNSFKILIDLSGITVDLPVGHLYVLIIKFLNYGRVKL